MSNDDISNKQMDQMLDNVDKHYEQMDEFKKSNPLGYALYRFNDLYSDTNTIVADTIDSGKRVIITILKPAKIHNQTLKTSFFGYESGSEQKDYFFTITDRNTVSIDGYQIIR